MGDRSWELGAGSWEQGAGSREIGARHGESVHRRTRRLRPLAKRSAGRMQVAHRNSSALNPLPSMMLLRVPTGIGLLPCTATITCRPFGWRLAEAVFAQHLNNVFSAANGKALAHVSATSSTFAPADNVTGAGSNQSSKASLALRTASSSVSPAEAHPGNSGKNAAQRLVSESCSTTSRSFIAAILTPCAVCGNGEVEVLSW